MLTINKRFPARDFFVSGSLQNTGESYLFFDIETTGFSRDHTILYLIGCGFLKDGAFQFMQWFNDDGTSEKQILLAFSKILQKKDWKLVTFNGNSFDIPYLKRHYELGNLSCPLTAHPSLDFYLFLKPFQILFEMEHGRQKDWECFLGLYREDKYDGGQLIAVYKDYLIKKDEALLSSLLLHNEEDLLGMKQLLPLLSYRCLLEADFSVNDIAPGSAGFPDGSAGIDFSCTLPLSLPRPLCVSSPAGNFFGEGKNVRVTLPFFKGQLKHFYKDYRNYYFLPEENRAVHKSVGRYVDRRYRKPAKASTCYVEKEGIFLALPTPQKHYGFQIPETGWAKKLPLYQEDFQEKTYYTEIGDLLHKEKAMIPLYLTGMTKEIFIAHLLEREKTPAKP